MKKVLIDAYDKEETRILELKNNVISSYNFETKNNKNHEGNIYLGKVTKIDRSLQALFMEYDNGEIGFLQLSEINIDHLDLSSEQKQELDDLYKLINQTNPNVNKTSEEEDDDDTDTEAPKNSNQEISFISESTDDENSNTSLNDNEDNDACEEVNLTNIDFTINNNSNKTELLDQAVDTADVNIEAANEENQQHVNKNTEQSNTEQSKQPILNNAHEQYITKIISYIKIGTTFLVQLRRGVRGNKKAVLSSYISIAGTSYVYMPYRKHSSGLISKKITSKSTQEKLRNVLDNHITNGHRFILRTAAAYISEEHLIQDLKRAHELWSIIQKKYAEQKTPGLIYEEGGIVKQIIRDSIYSDNFKIIISGQSAYLEAQLFAQLINPMILKCIFLHKKHRSLFSTYKVEKDVQSLHSPIVHLPSGGYLVIHNTEALTAIDINSGRYKKNKVSIENTALQTNIEAAEAIAKQLILRNIGGIIIIDFIDMKEQANRSKIESVIRNYMQHDKAKTQILPISKIGIMEVARQHINRSLIERTSDVCHCCQGVGYISYLELRSLNILRKLYDELSAYSKEKVITITVPKEEGFYILNEQRNHINNLEQLYKCKLNFNFDNNISWPLFTISTSSNNYNTASTSIVTLETHLPNNQSTTKIVNKNNNKNNNRNNNKNRNHKQHNNINKRNNSSNNKHYKKQGNKKTSLWGKVTNIFK